MHLYLVTVFNTTNHLFSLTKTKQSFLTDKQLFNSRSTTNYDKEVQIFAITTVKNYHSFFVSFFLTNMKLSVKIYRNHSKQDLLVYSFLILFSIFLLYD